MDTITGIAFALRIPFLGFAFENCNCFKGPKLMKDGEKSMGREREREELGGTGTFAKLTHRYSAW